MTFRWVVNASPIIVLARIERADLLKSLAAQLVVPVEVRAEIERGRADSPALAWLRSNAELVESKPQAVDSILAAWDLGSGESAVLAYARRTTSFEAVLDDLAARKCGAALAIHVRGTLSVLLEAKRTRLISSVSDELDRLKQAGYRVSERISLYVKSQAGET